MALAKKIGGGGIKKVIKIDSFCKKEVIFCRDLLIAF